MMKTREEYLESGMQIHQSKFRQNLKRHIKHKIKPKLVQCKYLRNLIFNQVHRKSEHPFFRVGSFAFIAEIYDNGSYFNLFRQLIPTAGMWTASIYGGRTLLLHVFNFISQLLNYFSELIECILCKNYKVNL